MEPHILFFDIDGTLLEEETGHMTERTKQALQEARGNGHYTFLNTGRSFAELDPRLTELDFDGEVCGCGRHIKYLGRDLKKKTIDGEEAQKIVEILEKAKVQGLLEGEEYFYISKHTTNPKLLAVKNGFGEEVNQKCRYWEEEKPSFQKLTIWLDKKSDLDMVKNYLQEKYDFIKRAEDFYEIIPVGHSKATGMEEVMRYLDIKREHTMAIGDSTNDLAMLEYANLSVAMGNSQDAVKEKVSFVTKSVTEEGVAHALSHFGFIK